MAEMNMAVTRQPGGYPPSDFQTGLLDCCSDCKSMCYGFFCLPCLGCSIASDMDECCLCGITMAIRSVYRTKYNIRGSLCKDYVNSQFCLCCSTCQLRRDIDLRRDQGIY